ncbi:ribonuclease III [Pseudanabaenaceae cyanobacterium LEGE 13415]|nr:ribonuclease III [Pseudanabaenaceae cyanobacterium LEGE 13415]
MCGVGENVISLNELGILDTSTVLPAPSSSEIQRLSPAALAYLGDAVYELYIRRRCLLPPKRSEIYHQQVVSQVRAETQASHLRSLMPYLSESEHEFLKRGRNAALNRPKRLDPEIYQNATSLEALIGFLYLTDPKRLFELLGFLSFE